jgi:hypothetical protein
MSNEDWERVKSILHRAMQFAPEPRARFLDEACAADLVSGRILRSRCAARSR